MNGAPKGSLNASDPLCAREEDPAVPAQLSVAPCFLPNGLAGPYWVLAVGGADPAK